MSHACKILLMASAITVASACAVSDEASAPPIDTPFTPRYATWVAIMENVMEPNFYDVMSVEAKKGAGNMNLTAIAAAADESANYVALGYGIHRDQSVAEFAELARSAETWLRAVSAQARSGDAIGLERLIREGEAKYCDRCHDVAQ